MTRLTPVLIHPSSPSSSAPPLRFFFFFTSFHWSARDLGRFFGERAPATHHVRGSNVCRIAVFADRVEGRAIVVSVTDDLVKGGAGQAVQNMNVMFGLDETAGLDSIGLAP